jgi:hypothetical protein
MSGANKKIGRNLHPSNLVPCPFCSAKMPAPSLMGHIQRKHNLARSTSQPVKREKKPRVMMYTSPTGTCSVCGKTMDARYLEDHEKLHEQAKKHPVPQVPVVQRIVHAPVEDPKLPKPPEPPLPDRHPTKKGGSHQGSRKGRRGTGGSLGGDWHRDGNGDLWFGEPEKRREFHIVDLGPTDRKPVPPKPVSTNSGAGKVENTPKKVVTNSQRIDCPACGMLIIDKEYGSHMARIHSRWCPICHKEVKRLLHHLELDHRVKMAVKRRLFYRVNWERLPLFICSICKEPLTQMDYNQHREYHQSAQMKHPSLVLPYQNGKGSQRVSCPICQKRIMLAILKYHMTSEHPGEALSQ